MALSPSEEEQCRYTIGIAFAPNKKETFFNPSFLSVASSRGLDLVPIDPSIPISSQSPQQFYLILHKLYDQQWTSNLGDFSKENPSVLVVDPMECIRRIQDRVSMLRFVSELKLPFNREQTLSDTNLNHHHHHIFGTPKQIVVDDSAALEDPAALSGLHFPIVAKPLRADGSNVSHKMALVFTRDALLKQPVPVVLQEFVNHGGVVFKVYVAGDYVKCVKRASIPDISDEMLAELSEKGSMPFSLISNMAPGEDLDDKAKIPPESFIVEIAQGLRRAMGLNLFNFDMIKDLRFRNHYLVIDVNYFPGYDKIPDYERVMTDFMWNIVHEKKKQDDSSIILGNDEKKKQDDSSIMLGNGDGKEKPLCCDLSKQEKEPSV